MNRIAAVVSITVTLFLSTGCGPGMKSVIEGRVPELKKMHVGTYDLGEFKSGQSTPFRMLPAVKNARCLVGFRTEPESRRFNIVLDDGRVFRVDDDNDLKKLATVRLYEQSFYLEFRQDMRMIVEVFEPQKQIALP